MSAFDPLAAECAVAVMGLENLLRGKPEWGAGKAMEARQLPKKINECLTRVISSTGRDGPVSGLPPFKFDEVAELLRKGPGDEMVQGINAKVPDPALAAGAANVATRIASQLGPPSRQRTTAIGVVPADPGPIAKGAFARKWWVANNPIVVFDDLDEGRLSPDMVRAFGSFWPGLNALAQAMIPRVIASIRVKRNKPEWTPVEAVDRQLSMLMGRVSSNDLALGGAFSALGAQPAAPTPSPRPENAKATNLSTPGQESQAQK